MAKISEGDEPQKVPLVYYDEEGERHVVGEAAVQIVDDEIIALGKLNERVRLNDTSGISIGSLGVEAFSIGVGPSPIEEASARLGILRLRHREHVTERNPNGETRQCNRRDIHGPHEWQAEFGAYFDVYCPGNTGFER